MQRIEINGTPIRACWTGIAEGDLSGLRSGPVVSELAGLLGLRGSAGGWTLSRLRQVHGGDVVLDTTVPVGNGHTAACSPSGNSGLTVVAGGSGAPGIVSGDAIATGDAIVSGDYRKCLTILVADCIPVALAAPEGVYGAVHAGWKGLAAGVIENAINTIRSCGASDVYAAIGPSIGKCCYEFSREDAMPLVRRYGESVMSTGSAGRETLDLRAAAGAAIERSGAQLSWRSEECTYCSGRYFSYRRGDGVSRQGMFVWRDS